MDISTIGTQKSTLSNKLIHWTLHSQFQLVHIVLLLVMSCGAWAAGLGQIDLSSMSDLGLISVLPPVTYVAFILLSLSFVLSVRQEPLRSPLIFLHVVILIFMLFGITALIEEMPRFAVNWRHVGIVEYITRRGSIDPRIDAYFNWPAFFIGNSFVTQLAGIQSSISLVPWAPVFFNLLYLLPVITILKTATDNWEAVWLGTWLFYLGNWIGQDYFSPQGINYFFYLVILAVLLRWFKQVRLTGNAPRMRWARFGLVSRIADPVYRWLWASSDPPVMTSRPVQHMGLLASIVVIFVASTSSHQLTPFAILGAVSALALFKRIAPRGLPILMAIIIATWISFMAVTYLQGHIAKLLYEVGAITSSIDENVTARLQGSPGHVTVVRIRLIMSLSIWALALLGAHWRKSRGHRDATWVLLVVAPFVLLGLQDYGGEMLLRVYLFSLPFMLIFVVSLFYPESIIGMSRLRAAAIFLLSSGLMIGFLFSRYGNERMDYKTVEEIDGARVLYRIAEPGSLMIALRPNVAWRFESYEKHRHRVEDIAYLSDDPGAIVGQMKQWNGPAFLFLTRTQQASAELFLDSNPRRWSRFQHRLVAAGLQEVFSNGDATIYALPDTRINHISQLEPLNIWEMKSFAGAALTLLFLFVVPGTALVRLLRLNDPLTEWMLAIALSLALDMVIAATLLYARVWYPEWGLAILIGITLGAVALSFSRRLKGAMAYTRKSYERSA